MSVATPIAESSRSIDRILHRHLILRGGKSTAAGEMTWDVSFPEGPHADDAPPLSFQLRFAFEDGQVVLHCDAPLDRYTAEQAVAVAELQTDVAESIERERITFASFEELAAYLVEGGAHQEEGTIEMPAGDESVFASIVPVAREPWVSLSTPFVDDASPEWLLDQNGNMTHLHFEAFEGGVSLACAFPLALLTAERLIELIDDLSSFRERLLEDLDGDEDDDG
jgi:hypothetical protein